MQVLQILLVSHSYLTCIITGNMKGAEFIGLDAINENLKDFQFDAIGVYQGKLEKFKRTSNEDENEVVIAKPNRIDVFTVFFIGILILSLIFNTLI